jgi:GNAT superfamily N-acetyltransferase
VIIRDLTPSDWARIHPFFTEIVAAGDSYAYPDDLSPAAAHALWTAPGHTVVAVDDAGAGGAGDVVATATMGPNRPGRGDHVATGSFMVDPRHAGRGIGRMLGEHLVDWATGRGFRAIQFNAVVETNSAAVHLWRSLGFEILATVPEAFRHRERGLVGLHIMHRTLGPIAADSSRSATAPPPTAR